MAQGLNDPMLITTAGVGTIAILGGIAKGAQWQDPKTGKVSVPALVSGLALSLVMATGIRAAGVHYGVEPWVQVFGAGLFCYVGPDPILRAVAGMALKKFGISTDEGRTNVQKP